MSLPFRTAPSSTPAPVVPAESGAEFERVDETIELARTVTAADARLRGWINHHDERVPLALIGGALAPWLARTESWSLHLYARAMRDAERDGVCWTPLLDRLAESGIWPTQKGRVVLGGKVSVVHPAPVMQVIEPLRLWLREQTDGAALAPLAAFRASPVRALIQSRLAVLPAVASFTGEYPSPHPELAPAETRVTVDAHVNAATVRGDAPGVRAAEPAVAHPAARVPTDVPATAPAPASAAAGHVAASVLAAQTAQAQAVPVRSAPAQPATSQARVSTAQAATPQAATPQAATAQVATPQAATAQAATAAGATASAPATATASASGTPAPAPLAPPAVPAPSQPPGGFGPHGVVHQAATAWMHAAASPAVPVVENLYTPTQVSGLMTVAEQATGRTDEAQVRPEIRKAINTLIEYRALPSEKLYSLYSACRLVKTWVVRIVAHVSATIELWRAALRDNNWIEVRESIVRSATARRDSVIRLILSRCGSPDVLCALCLDGDMPDVSQIARRVRSVNPRGLLEALTIAVRTTGLRLTAMDLSPLVHHEDPEVRQQALALLHLMVRPA